jgi:CRP/FNR family transcriptional regulator, cyclic AMP receptor protein
LATVNIFRYEQHTEQFLAGQVIFDQGEPGEVMYVVQEGEVDIFIGERLLETTGPGGVIGEMALVDRTARSATAVAKTDCKLVPLDENRFKTQVHQTPFFAVQVMRILADRLRRADRLLQQL